MQGIYFTVERAGSHAHELRRIIARGLGVRFTSGRTVSHAHEALCYGVIAGADPVREALAIA